MVDLRCPELADLETRLAGELIPVDDELYGLWIALYDENGNERTDTVADWYNLSGVVWTTSDVRIAYAQQHGIQRSHVWRGLDHIVTVRRLGPKGEPLELD